MFTTLAAIFDIRIANVGSKINEKQEMQLKIRQKCFKSGLKKRNIRLENNKYPKHLKKKMTEYKNNEVGMR